MSDFYVISAKHSHKKDRYITFWRPDDRGYCFKLPGAGKYTLECIQAHLGYYNDGDNIAVPVEVVDGMTVMTCPEDYLDGPDGPAVLSIKKNWNVLIASAIEQPKYPVKPACFAKCKRRPTASQESAQSIKEE